MSEKNRSVSQNSEILVERQHARKKLHAIRKWGGKAAHIKRVATEKQKLIADNDSQTKIKFLKNKL